MKSPGHFKNNSFKWTFLGFELTRSLTRQWLLQTVESNTFPRSRQRHLENDIVDEALERQFDCALSRDDFVDPTQERFARVHERSHRHEAQRLADEQLVFVEVELTLVAIQMQTWTVAVARRLRSLFAMFCLVHVLQSLHSCANASIADALVESQDCAVNVGSVLAHVDERVELGRTVFPLRLECDASRLAELECTFSIVFF